MCESCDILQSSYKSANAMTNSFCDYGNGSMGYGIRKFAEEMFNAGANEGYKTGCSDGYSIGFLEGAIISTAAVAVVGFTVWGVKKLSDKWKEKKTQQNIPVENDILSQEVTCNA